MKSLVVSAAVLMCAGSPVLAKECRMPDVPPGVRIQVPQECRDRFEPGRLEAKRQNSVGADQGFIDLGNGTQVRIGGRIRAEGTARR